MAYSFGEKALSLTLKQTKRDGDQQPREISIAALLDEVKGRDFQIEDTLTIVRVVTDESSFELRGSTFHLKAAVTILDLQKEGVKPFASRWFWFDTGESDTTPTKNYAFFVIHEEEIIREEISFLDYPDSGFDPTIFEAGDDARRSSWLRHLIPPSSEASWQLASAAYWYRRFYRETKMGQLMVLRPDWPELHYFPEGRSWHKRYKFSLIWTAIGVLLVLIVALLIRK